MNKVLLIGRLTRDPEDRYTQGQQATSIARYTLAVDRRYKKEGDPQTADFISCVAFGKLGEFAEKYLRKGIKICVTGRIQTGSYTNRDGQKVYTTEVVVEEQEFVESKAAAGNASTGDNASAGNSSNAASNSKPSPAPSPAPEDTFMNIPDDLDEELPFN